mgnify:CR=1 FL=1
MSKTISKRGIVVDFDILRMKQEMMSAIPDTVVVERSESIEDSILKRREQRRRQRQLQLERQMEQKKVEQAETENQVEKSQKDKENRPRVIKED